jgi:FG-GAP-like repeat
MRRAAAARRLPVCLLAALTGIVSAIVLAPTASAAGTLPEPTSFGTSPAPLSGSPADPCGFTKPYGYIGAGDITFRAVISVPGLAPAAAEFAIVPGDGSPPLRFTTAPLPDGLTASITIPRTDFSDGVTYAWRVREVDSGGDQSPYTRTCHFISDQLAPPQPAVSSSVFTTTSPPVARTPGTFTFTAAGPDAGDAVAFDYALNTSLGAGGTFPGFGNAYVPVGPGGTATTPTLIPTRPGPNFLTVDTVDRAGNVSQPVTYQFVLLSPPPDVRGDLNGDHVPDLVAVTKAGRLQIYFGTGTGMLGPKTVFADSGTGWRGAMIAQNGSFSGGPYQDLLAIQRGSLLAYTNNGLGDFSGLDAIGESRPNGGNWLGVRQLIASGDITGDGLPDVVTREGNLLLLWAGQFGGLAPGVVIGTGWQNLSAVGAADFTGDGITDLLARGSAGQLWLYPGNGLGTFGDITTRLAVGTGFTAAKYPLITSIGDANGDGVPDLYATTAAGGLVFIPGISGGGFGKPVPVTGTRTNWLDVTSIG